MRIQTDIEYHAAETCQPVRTRVLPSAPGLLSGLPPSFSLTRNPCLLQPRHSDVTAQLSLQEGCHAVMFIPVEPRTVPSSLKGSGHSQPGTAPCHVQRLVAGMKNLGGLGTSFQNLQGVLLFSLLGVLIQWIAQYSWGPWHLASQPSPELQQKSTGYWEVP